MLVTATDPLKIWHSSNISPFIECVLQTIHFGRMCSSLTQPSKEAGVNMFICLLEPPGGML